MFDLHPVDGPYPGLRPFEPHEGEIFFGRERHTDRLLEILKRERFLAVVGPSGGGKSSLVRAGLLPALAGGRLGTGSHWRLALLRPGAQPQLALATALVSRHALGPELGAGDQDAAPPNPVPSMTAATAEQATADAALVAAELRRDEQGLARVLATAQAERQARNRARNLPNSALPTLNLLILVDQFEELFTYRSAAPDPAEAARFIGQLLQLCRHGEAPGIEPELGGIRVVVALTLRTDFLGHCVEFANLPEAINHAQYLTPRLRDDELRLAVTGPARLFKGEVDGALADAAIAQSTGNPDQLPMLQHALAQWWLQAKHIQPQHPVINSACTERAGEVGEALDRHATRLYKAMSPEAQHACEWLFRAITAGREGADAVRRPQRLSDISIWSGVPVTTLEQVVRELASPEVSFLHHGTSLDGDSVIDMTHEALMRQWAQLRVWVADELRQAQALQRWQARADERGSGGLLAKLDLARALGWWNPDAVTTANGQAWVPTQAWSLRYQTTPATLLEKSLVDESSSFLRLRQFLIDSREEAQRQEAVEQQRQLDAAQQAEREQATRRFRYAVFVGLVCSVALLVAAVWQRDQAKAQMNAAREANEIATQKQESAAAAWEEARTAQDEAKERLRQVTLVTQYFAGAIDATRLDQAVAADQEIQKILKRSTPADVQRRARTPLEIWAKDVDRDNVRATLMLLGFPIEPRKAKLPADATNAVWAGTAVPADDTRLVALGLIRAGIQVLSVGPIQPGIVGRDRQVLQAGASREPLGCRAFSVAELSSMTEFTRETRDHCKIRPRGS
ncbi:nSTAND1 domain-containing NTPase [Roseateles sp. DB2]|uniref:nSTAND1 domain-containing NTPase n=1 Tax=Roseateles sp. DB2 TaxID=3453717 RepID=UPI003EED9B8A